MTEPPKIEHQVIMRLHCSNCLLEPCPGHDPAKQEQPPATVMINTAYYQQLVATDRDCKFIIQKNVELAKEVVRLQIEVARLLDLSGGLELRLGSAAREKNKWICEWETAQSQLKTLKKHLDPTERRSFDDQKALAGQLLGLQAEYTSSQNAVEQQRQELGKIRADLIATQKALDEERQQVARLNSELVSVRTICAALNKEYPALAEERRILSAIRSFVLSKVPSDNSTCVPVGP